MEDKETINNIIRNIISEVLRECKNRRIKTNAGFLAYYINLLRLDPNRNLTSEHLSNREDVLKFIKFIVDRFENKIDTQMLTLELQHEFNVYFNELEQAVSRFRTKLERKLYPLMLEIIEQNDKNNTTELYNKITVYLTLASGLGNPYEKPVFKEAMQVVKSVLDPDEIEIFPSLQHYIKRELIKCLADITSGIRLYNRACKKGGEGIPDLPKLMQISLEAVRLRINEFMEDSMRKAKFVIRFVEKHMRIKQSKNEYSVQLDFKTPEEKMKWVYMRELVITYRQEIKTFRKLLTYITELDENRKSLNEKYQNIISLLNRIVVPTLYQAITEVFPHFTDLAQIWKCFQNDAIRLKETYNIFKVQARMIIQLGFDLSLEQELPYLEKWVSTHDTESIEPTENPNIIIHRDTTEYSRLDMEFRGYCCWILTHTEGALIQGDVSLGVIEYKNKYYCFTSNAAANCFIEQPEEYIMKVIELARNKVHLIAVLDLEETMRQYVNIKVLVEKKEQRKVLVNNMEVQTDTHPYASNIDRSYFWNIWDYKRNVLGMRELLNKVTTGTMTLKTYQMESNRTQTYDQKESNTQITKDSYTNTKNRLRYFRGLRGCRKVDCPFIVNLSTPDRFSQEPKFVFNKPY